VASIVERLQINKRLNVEEAVRRRYSNAAKQAEAALCCPVEYGQHYLEIIPQEIIDRDYGCGDPSKLVSEGEVVLDLGSGGGKICYIAAQIVGASGKVFGVDCNDEMLALAHKYQGQISETLGYDNVRFLRGRIQDLGLNLDLLDRYLAEHPVNSSADWLALEEQTQHLRETSPLVAGESIDVIVSNCVLNLVRPEDRRQLFREMYRVLRRAGRAVISDIVSDEDVPDHLRSDAGLWSGCISGAYREDRLLAAFEEAGFYGIEIVARQPEAWAVVDGIEFRSVTIRAFKGKEGPCLERRQAVIYNGPWNAVIDDDGHKLLRGQRMAVCDKIFEIYARPPYADQITPLPPTDLIPLEEAPPFDCSGTVIRSPRETKGDASAQLTQLPAGGCCEPDDCC
jgi:ubiquinone/menaquinone biosynthesis C-methylase UbiE